MLSAFQMLSALCTRVYWSGLHALKNVSYGIEHITWTEQIFSVFTWEQALCIYYVAVYSGNQSIYDYLWWYNPVYTLGMLSSLKKNVTNYLPVSVLNYYWYITYMHTNWLVNVTQTWNISLLGQKWPAWPLCYLNETHVVFRSPENNQRCCKL